jgi:hypothetical protein
VKSPGFYRQHSHYARLEYRKAVVAPIISELDTALADLQQLGLTVRLHSPLNNTWHISDGGLYGGYVVRAEELVDLRQAKRLSLQAIIDLVASVP